MGKERVHQEEGGLSIWKGICMLIPRRGRYGSLEDLMPLRVDGERGVPDNAGHQLSDGLQIRQRG